RLPETAYRGQKTVSFTARIEERRRSFASPDVVSHFVDLLADAVTGQACIVPLYSFTPDHLHVLVCGTTPNSMTTIAMDWFKETSGTWFYDNQPSVHWQSYCYDHIMRKSDDLLNHARYIMANPVRAGLVAEWIDYRFTGSIGIELAEYLRDLDE